MTKANDHEKKEIASVAEMMFFGEINEADLLPFPHFSPEQKEMAKEMTSAVKKFGEASIDSTKLDRESKIPDEIFQELAGLGLFGLAVGEEYGGLNLDTTLYARVFQEIAGIDGSVATMLGAHQSIGYKALLNEGTEEQKKKWLPRLASGEVVAAFCLTEPGSGSDAYSIKTKATDNKDGTYTINGQKLWITNGGRAGFYSVFCKTEHPGKDKKTGKDIIEEKISCFIVEKDFPGISFGEKEDKMGIRASETRAVYFDKVKVPATNMLGEPGKGFKIAMNVLNTGRLSIGSGCVGGMKSIFKIAVDHAKNRKQFGDVIANYGMIQQKLATIAAHIYACESMAYFTTGQITRGMKNYSIESAICKIYSSEKLWECVDQCMQIAAGNGYMKEYPYERLMRDSRINMIFEGTNEILRIYIALSGLKGPGDELKELGRAADFSNVLHNPIKSLGVLTDYASKKIGKMVSTKTLTKVHPKLSKHAENFSSMLHDFYLKVESTIMKLGKNIIGSELPQRRLANMAIELYVMLAVLLRTTAILNDASVSEDDKDYVLKMTEVICRDNRQEFMRNFKRISATYDTLIPEVSKHVCKRDGYGLDIIDF
ncbi:MAG: acyl-CoA dehydrogenase family protein [Bacteriovoracaceae bacterium]|nr:acyl-CoA dehydrogenase family protein [Bacteriovoracaceae bacterium]